MLNLFTSIINKTFSIKNPNPSKSISFIVDTFFSLFRATKILFLKNLPSIVDYLSNTSVEKKGKEKKEIKKTVPRVQMARNVIDNVCSLIPGYNTSCRVAMVAILASHNKVGILR